MLGAIGPFRLLENAGNNKFNTFIYMSKTKLGILGLFLGLAVVSGTWFALHVKAQPEAASAQTEALTAEDRAALKQALDELGVALTQLQANINSPQSGVTFTAERQANIHSALGGLQTALTGLDSALDGTNSAVAVQLPPSVQTGGGAESEDSLVLAKQKEDKTSDLLAANQTAQASAAADGFNWNKALLAGFLVAAGAAGLTFYFRLRRKEVKRAGGSSSAPAPQETAAAVPTANSQQA